MPRSLLSRRSGGIGFSDLELVDELEHALPGQDLFAHPSPMEAQRTGHGQDHFLARSAEFTLLTQ